MEGSSVDGFECQVEERFRSEGRFIFEGQFRSACSGAANYEYEDKRYCILHLPSESKVDEFDKAVQSKLERNDLKFAGVYFPSNFGGFRQATFSGEADFLRATFSQAVSFYGATFSAWTNFSGATFSEWMDFSGAAFSKEASFAGATFSQRAIFTAATFSQSANFSGATFSGGAVFGAATFSQAVSFSEATFSQEVLFGWSTFKEGAVFFGLKTHDQTAFDFRGAIIDKPERISFHTTPLRPSWFVDVDAQKFDFTDVEWFRLPNGDKRTLESEIEALSRRYIQEPESLRKLTRACRRLMNNAEDDRDYPTANEFHYWSMEAVRMESWRRLGLIPTLYWALSGYGDRPRRAFWVLVAIWLAFAALYFLIVASSPFWVFSASGVWQGIGYGGQALVYSLSALVRLNPRPQSEQLDWFDTLVTVEGILGPLQIALFLLAVRRKVMR